MGYHTQSERHRCLVALWAIVRVSVSNSDTGAHTHAHLVKASRHYGRRDVGTAVDCYVRSS